MDEKILLSVLVCFFTLCVVKKQGSDTLVNLWGRRLQASAVEKMGDDRRKGPR